jgi:hypothetical protein
MYKTNFIPNAPQKLQESPVTGPYEAVPATKTALVSLSPRPGGTQQPCTPANLLFQPRAAMFGLRSVLQ